MTKKNQDKLPSVTEPAKPDVEKSQVSAEPEFKEPLRGLIEVPIGEYDGKLYATRSLHCDPLTNDQHITFKRIWAGLMAKSAYLKNGMPVRSQADAFRWMMEHVAI